MPRNPAAAPADDLWQPSRPAAGLGAVLADWAWGATLRWRVPARRPGLDSVSGLVREAGFLQQASQLAWQCSERGQPMSVAMFDFSDLVEVHRMYGGRLSGQLLAKLARALWRTAGRRGLAARVGPAQFAVAMPQLGQTQARMQVHRVLGKVPCIELDAGGDELVLVADFLVAQVEPTDLEALFHQLRAGLARVQERRQRIEDYLQRGPVNLTRPAELH